MRIFNRWARKYSGRDKTAYAKAINENTCTGLKICEFNRWDARKSSSTPIKLANIVMWTDAMASDNRRGKLPRIEAGNTTFDKNTRFEIPSTRAVSAKPPLI